jgi:hypothetical protein
MPSKKTVDVTEEALEVPALDSQEPQEPALVAVTIIATQGKSALVEWDGGTRRGFVPVSAVVAGGVPAPILSAAVPYGVDWTKLKPHAADFGERLAVNLRGRGIWAWADLQHMQQEAFAALQVTYQVDLSSLNMLAYETQEV